MIQVIPVFLDRPDKTAILSKLLAVLFLRRKVDCGPPVNICQQMYIIAHIKGISLITVISSDILLIESIASYPRFIHCLHPVGDLCRRMKCTPILIRLPAVRADITDDELLRISFDAMLYPPFIVYYSSYDSWLYSLCKNTDCFIMSRLYHFLLITATTLSEYYIPEALDVLPEYGYNKSDVRKERYHESDRSCCGNPDE